MRFIKKGVTRMRYLLQLSVMLLSIAGVTLVAEADGAWERDGQNILDGFHNLYQPNVIFDPDDATHPSKMWFMGWAVVDNNTNIPGNTGSDAIWHARSTAPDAAYNARGARHGRTIKLY